MTGLGNITAQLYRAYLAYFAVFQRPIFAPPTRLARRRGDRRRSRRVRRGGRR